VRLAETLPLIPRSTRLAPGHDRPADGNGRPMRFAPNGICSLVRRSVPKI